MTGWLGRQTGGQMAGWLWLAGSGKEAGGDQAPHSPGDMLSCSRKSASPNCSQCPLLHPTSLPSLGGSCLSTSTWGSSP